MKTVIIIRHAKSGWDNAFASDFDRTLNDRGNKDAHQMALRLKGRSINIDACISSPAVRAATTAEIFATTIGWNNPLFIPALYHASPSIIAHTIHNCNEQLNSIVIVAHNPGITEFVNSLTSEVRTDNVPTCGMFAVNAAISSWKEFADAKKTLLFYDYPKLLS
jgi:phosphohistidine phosphatase